MNLKRLNLLNRRMASGYFEKHELMLGPLYGNITANGWVYRGGALRSGRVFALLREDRSVAGVAARFNDGNAMVHAENELDVLYFAEILREEYFHTLWMLGCGRETARKMTDAMDADAGIEMEDMLLQREPTDEPDRGLSFQDISTDPYDPEYLSAAQRMLKECFHYNPSREVMAARTAERTAEEVYLLGMLEGEWVCQAHIQAWTPNYGHIGGVATLPYRQGQGLAKSITAHLCRYIHDEGHLPTLTVLESNAPAQALYRSLGFEKVGTVAVLSGFQSRNI